MWMNLNECYFLSLWVGTVEKWNNVNNIFNESLARVNYKEVSECVELFYCVYDVT